MLRRWWERANTPHLINRTTTEKRTKLSVVPNYATIAAHVYNLFCSFSIRSSKDCCSCAWMKARFFCIARTPKRGSCSCSHVRQKEKGKHSWCLLLSKIKVHHEIRSICLHFLFLPATWWEQKRILFPGK